MGMAERIVLTQVNLADGFGATQWRTLLLMRALAGRPVVQQLVVKKGGVLEEVAQQWGFTVLSVRPYAWPGSKSAIDGDLAHAHGRASWRWTAAGKRPYIAGMDGHRVESIRLPGSGVVAVAPTRSLVEQIHACMPQLPVERIPPLYDDRIVPQGEEQSNLAIQLRGRFVFGLCCSYAPESGIEDALEAMRWLTTRNHKAHLLVVGFNGLTGALRARARSLGAVTLLEKQTDPAAWFGLFNAYLSPARKAMDDNGLVQAMYAGLPIIATWLTAMDDFVQQGQSAILMPSLDPPALGKAMFDLMKDDSLTFRLGATARRHVEKFSPQVVGERAFRLYQTICSQP